ncbi:TIR domain-containing protein [Candidatus Poriferisodalis sp.]|uniref:TIR domain-containing protein n=1 Tax=Candidatus Poriferisodalis sp. TaxID=3101277 RepID=UPI003B02A511
MAYRNVFFSFEWNTDVWRAMIVRNCGQLYGAHSAGFRPASEIEEVKRRGEDAIRRWIDSQLEGTTVTVVLLGATTNQSKWVNYECGASLRRENGIVLIDISSIPDRNGHLTTFGGLPDGWSTTSSGATSPYLFETWDTRHSPQQFGTWVEQAARNVGK